MSLEFLEHRCKRKYKSKQHKFPLLRLILLFVVLFFAYRFGFFSKLINSISFLEKKADVTSLNWMDSCNQVFGTPFELRDSLVQCSWIVNDSTPIFSNSFLRYVVSNRKMPISKLHWIATKSDFSNALAVIFEDSISTTYFRIKTQDSLYTWIDARTGCRYPGFCPQQPLAWSILPITEDFDFFGQDELLAMDELRGVGEAPIYPILSGRVLKSGKDSLGYFVEIDHGNNIYSKMSGMFRYERDSLVLDSMKFIDEKTMLGRLAPRDSASVYLTIRRNGSFVRWNDFYNNAHPIDSAKISKFKEQIGF